MKLDPSKTEKGLLIEQFKSDLTKLGVSEVNFPTSEDQYLLSAIEEIPDVEDSHDDVTVTPNSSVTIQFNDAVESSKQYSSKMNFRRLDASYLIEKKFSSMTPEVLAHDETLNAKETDTHAGEIKAKVIEALESCTDTKLTATLDPAGSKTNLVEGTTTAKLTVENTSFILRNSQNKEVKVKNRADNVGVIVELNKSTGVPTDKKPFYVKTHSGEQTFGNQHAELKTLDLTDGDTIWQLFYPKTGMSSVSSGFFESLSENKAGTIYVSDILPPNCSTIESDALHVVRAPGQKLTIKVKAQGSSDPIEGANYNGKTPVQFFNEIEYIEPDAIGPAMDFDLDNQVIVFPKANLYLDDGAFKEGFDLGDAKFASLTSMLDAFKDTKWNNATWEPKHTQYGEEFTSNQYQHVGKLVLKKDNSTYGNSITTLWFKKTDVATETGVFKPNSKPHFAEWIKEVKLPEDLTTLPPYFLHGCEPETLEISQNVTVSENAFKASKIKELIVKGSSESEVLFEEGAFDGATIEKITVENNAVKAKVEEKLNNLTKVPTWNVKTTTQSGTVPPVVSSTGFNYDD